MNANQNKTFVNIRVHSWLIITALVLAACGNPRRDAPLDTPPDPPPVNKPAPPEKQPVAAGVVLEASYKVGQRFRTTRTLRVNELTNDGTINTTADEISVTEVKTVDPRGQLIRVVRSYERSRQSLARAHTPEEITGALEGAVLELVRENATAPVTATLVKGDNGLTGLKFLIDGFDAALLPAGDVEEGAAWSIAGKDIAGLNAIVEALKFRIEKNRLDCRLVALSTKTAAISIDWRLTGSFNNVPAVLEFTGDIEFDREANLVRKFTLTGGRQGGGKSVDITVTRENQ